ncbi:MAG TPA: hypothetical protein VI933_05120 [archaeon]|nr:hypothetical protein [archaeon]
MKKIFFVFFVVAVFSNLAAAEELADFSVTTKISTDGISRSTITISLEEFSGEVRVPVPYEISRLSFDSNFGKLSCIKESKVYGTDILCSIPQETSGSFKTEFDVENLVRSSDDKFFFKQEVSVPINSKKFSFRAILPEGMGIDGIGGIFPKDAESSSDGRNIFLTWRKDFMSAGETFSSQVVFEPLSAQSGGPSGLIAAGSLIALPIALAFGYFYFRKFKENALTPRLVLPVLKEDEKKVAEGLIKHGSGVNQKVIVVESGYSKAKVSKVLKSLAERGILKFERVGRSNRIYWSEEFKKKGGER